MSDSGNGKTPIQKSESQKLLDLTFEIHISYKPSTQEMQFVGPMNQPVILLGMLEQVKAMYIKEQMKVDRKVKGKEKSPIVIPGRA